MFVQFFSGYKAILKKKPSRKKRSQKKPKDLGNKPLYFARGQLCIELTNENTELVEELMTNN